MVLVSGRFTVRPEKRKEVFQTLHSIVGQVRKERGCLRAGCYQDVEDEGEYLFIEEWATQGDLDDHLRSVTFTVLLGAGSLLTRPPEIVTHTVSRSVDLQG